VADCVCSRRRKREVNPLFLHGSTGTGKSHLVCGLAAEITQRCPDLIVSIVEAHDYAIPLKKERISAPEPAQTCDVLIVEDLQHLPVQASPLLAQVFDSRLSRHQQMIFTALAGPGQLPQLPARLAARLASGLVVALRPLCRASRLALLQHQARQRGLAVESDILDWLSKHIGSSGRQVVGALNRLEKLVELNGRPLSLTAVAEQFLTEQKASRLTMERITKRVSSYFQVEPGQLCSRARARRALLPRQVSMYLARRLTTLSLQQIGAYFGGHDHSTVIYACRKIEQALTCDTSLVGAIRHLHADLG
jgi:chromosomal replication initiator protein